MTSERRRRVLFVGNSYTFYNDVPGRVARLRPGLETDRVAEGGAHLRLHWERTGARQRVENGSWDAVVVQEMSTGPLHDRARFLDYGTRLVELVRRSGARPYLYLTWARKAGHAVYRDAWSGGSPAEMLRRLVEAYGQLADTAGATVVPVGVAWEAALREDPALPLHDEDKHHATPLGSQLAAIVFAAVLSSSPPRSFEGATDPDVGAEQWPALIRAAEAALDGRREATLLD